MSRDIERENTGWLVGRSLRDGEMQDLLAQAKPNWQWEPTLGSTRCYRTGIYWPRDEAADAARSGAKEGMASGTNTPSHNSACF